MSRLPLLAYPQLESLARLSESVDKPCDCAKLSLAGWASMPVSFPEDQLHAVGTLRDDTIDEPTVVEHHPNGTQYWGETAPIAPRFYPYNLCDVSQCGVCERAYLTYNEGGGYFFDRRIRALSASLLVDVNI